MIMKLQMNNNRGFTLIELLVVIALTAIVMLLVFKPVTDSFNLTRRAQVVIQAQNSARSAMALVRRDLSEAMFVYDNSSDAARINFPVGVGANSTALVRYAKVDMVLPRMQGYCTASDSVHNPNGTNNPRQFDRVSQTQYQGTLYKGPIWVDSTGKPVEGDAAAPICPYDGSTLELRPARPLTPDTKIVRYFIGLADPTKPYCNRYLKIAGMSGTNNMFILYRAEFSLYDTTNSSGQPTNSLFPTGRPATTNLNDPNFFYNTGNNGLTNSDGSPQTYEQAWALISTPVVQIPNTDLITLTFDSNNNAVVAPLVSFAPTAIYNDPLLPTVDPSAAPEYGTNTVPTVYKATYGNWISPYQVILRRDANHVYQTEGYTDPTTNNSYMGIFLDSNTHPISFSGGNVANLVFDITRYVNTSTAPGAAGTPDTAWQGYTYGAGVIDPVQPQVAFTVDVAKGRVNFAFPHVNVQLSNSLTQLLGGPVAASVAIPTSSIDNLYNDAAAQSADQNRYRMWVYNNPQNVTMPYIGTSVTAQQFLANSATVPGMEKVIGPCAILGGNYGNPVQYSHIPLWSANTDPGTDQYKIDPNYTMLDNNGNALTGMPGTAAIYFRSQQTDTGNGAELPTDADIVSVRGNDSGTIQNVYLLYYEQNNLSSDILRANYVTKNVMTITMGVQVFDPATNQPLAIQLSNQFQLRNIANR
jgi:prepilin-type N-terminal cleavage/methylation domain-containing protein